MVSCSKSCHGLCRDPKNLCVVYVSSKLIKRWVTGVEMGPGVDGVLHISFLGGGGRCSWTMEQEEEDNESLT